MWIIVVLFLNICVFAELFDNLVYEKFSIILSTHIVNEQHGFKKSKSTYDLWSENWICTESMVDYLAELSPFSARGDNLSK